MVRLREGLLTAKGRKLEARDVLFSLQRARRGGALAWWGDLPVPSLHPKGTDCGRVRGPDGLRIANALSSPLFALVPRGFDPVSRTAPGRCRRRQQSGAAAQTQCERGARRVVSRGDRDRPGARSFWRRCGRSRAISPTSVGSAPGFTHRDPVPWPSTWVMSLDRFADRNRGRSVGRARGRATAPRRTSARAAPALRARAASRAVGKRRMGRQTLRAADGRRIGLPRGARPGGELATFASGTRSERQRGAGGGAEPAEGRWHLQPCARCGPPVRRTWNCDPGRAGRRLDPSLALELMRSPPRLSTFSPRALTRTLRLGVLGELRVVGAHAPDVRLAKSTAGEGWDLGATYRAPA